MMLRSCSTDLTKGFKRGIFVHTVYSVSKKHFEVKVDILSNIVFNVEAAYAKRLKAQS